MNISTFKMTDSHTATTTGRLDIGKPWPPMREPAGLPGDAGATIATWQPRGATSAKNSIPASPRLRWALRFWGCAQPDR